MEDPVNRQKVELAKTFTFHLLKGIKQIGMYRHNEARFPEFLQKSLDALTEYTTAYGPLIITVEAQNFHHIGQALFSEDSPLPYKFYRDGIRRLVFRPELSMDELVTFTLIAISDPERGAEDVNAQLWKAGLDHIEYILVEGFKMDEFSEEEVQVEVDKIVHYLQGRLRAESDDYLRFARVSTEDLDAQLDGIEQIRGAVITGVTADDSLKAKVQKDVLEEETQRLFPKLVNAVFQVVEGGVEDPSLLEDMFVQLLDAMLIQEDFSTINQVVLKLRAMEQKEDAEVIKRIREAFTNKMGEEQRLNRIGEILRGTRPKSPADIVRYLQALDAICAPTLLAVLETIEIPENRALLCDVLAGFAREVPEPYVNRLSSDRPQTIRDMVYILEKANHPQRIKMFGPVLKSKNLAIKLEVMSIIAKGRTGEARQLIAECLNDSVQQVRLLALKLLPTLDRERAYLDLTRIVKDSSFGKRSAEEKQAAYRALGATGEQGAVALFTQVLQTKPSLFNKQKLLEDKLLAVQGLEGACSIQSYKVLQELVEDKSQPSELLVAARRALYVHKKALLGDKGQEKGAEA
ncbi:MAG: HEAT repeat domain-containing protein [Myxococcales bacterium]|nr:HEAT repeat domain-containing protein [Myxococcales bacterium]